MQHGQMPTADASSNLPRVHVFALGGTIAMAGRSGAAPHSGVVPRLDAGMLVDAVPELGNVARVTAHSFRQLPGAHLRFADLEALAGAIEAAQAAGADGVVVTQGTDTIEETAFALDRLLAPALPVVVTGAMRNASVAGADGPGNLLAAVRVAASPLARGSGCLVVMNDRIHAARFVRKLHTHGPDAFASPQLGPIGWVAEDRVRIAAQLPPWPALARQSQPEDSRVALVTLGFDDDGSMLRCAGDQGCSGVVVAALGGGHCSPAAADAIGALARHCDVVLASRSGAGEVLQTTYGFTGSEIDLLGRGAVAAGWLDALKARVLLSLLHRHGVRGPEAARAFSALATP